MNWNIEIEIMTDWNIDRLKYGHIKIIIYFNVDRLKYWQFDALINKYIDRLKINRLNNLSINSLTDCHNDQGQILIIRGRFLDVT